MSCEGGEKGVDDLSFEKMLERLFKQDFSEGTEAFRDALLARCLEELNAAEDDEGPGDSVREIGEDELDMLAAAGDLARDFEKDASASSALKRPPRR